MLRARRSLFKKIYNLFSQRPYSTPQKSYMREELETFLEEVVLPPHHRSTYTFRQGRFDNPWPTWDERNFSHVWRWSRERRKLGLPSTGHLSNNLNPQPADFLAAFPPAAPDALSLASPPADAVQACWLGHATVLAQIGGASFLTDPVFAERCSPISFLGPKRVVPPVMTAASPELPKIDAVLISHNHYDHLCTSSLKALVQRFGAELKFFVPLGLASWFKRHGFNNVTELDWWADAEFNGVRVTFTPAQHWSQRGVLDRKSSLWGGWALAAGDLKFWFAGDTGYAPVFKEIGKRVGPFDLAAIPTGAYAPRWFMRPQHVNPEEAVLVHKDIKSKQSFAIHLATFPLTDEPMDEPVALLKSVAAEAGLRADEFVTLRHGAHICTAAGQLRNVPSVMPTLEEGDP